MERLNFNMRYLANLKGKRCIFYLPTHVSILLNLHYRYANLLHPINVPFLSPATTSIAANDSSVWQLTQKKTWAEGLGDLQCPDVNIHISYPRTINTWTGNGGMNDGFPPVRGLLPEMALLISGLGWPWPFGEMAFQLKIHTLMDIWASIGSRYDK